MTARTPGFLVIAASVALVACADHPLQPSAEGDPSVAGAGAGPGGAEAAETSWVAVFDGGALDEFAAHAASAGATMLLNHEIGVAVLTGLDEESAAVLQRASGAEYVERLPSFELLEPAAIGAPERAGALAGAAPAVHASNDPTTAILYGVQWNMHQIRAAPAWAAGRLGDPSVTVAILDTGIDYMLPDLAGRVDLSRSASFVALDNSLVAALFPGRHPSTDLHYHGTNVATQVASNAWAFAGVTSKTTLMAVKVCSAAGGCPGVTQGILHAIDNGADVINMSLGGWFRKSAFPGTVAAYNRIMNYAARRGVTVVVSAGNDGNDLDTQKNIAIKNSAGVIIDRIHIPSFFSSWCDATHVICVAATRRDDVPATYSNYGRSAIDVAAPGGQGQPFNDWVYALCPQTSLVLNCGGGLFSLGVAGTSQAAPHVAGLAALAVQDVGRNPARVRAYIRNSADPIGKGNTPHYGRGRINVARATGTF